MRVRTSCGHEWLQGAAGTLGQGPHADGEKDPAEGIDIRCAVARQSGSLLPPHREYQLSADGVALDDAPPRDDRALPAGLVSDAAHRLTTFPGVHVLDFQLLSVPPKGNSSQTLVAHFSLPAVCDGHGYRNLRPQCTGSDRGATRKKERVRPHS